MFLRWSHDIFHTWQRVLDTKRREGDFVVSRDKMFWKRLSPPEQKADAKDPSYEPSGKKGKGKAKAPAKASAKASAKAPAKAVKEPVPYSTERLGITPREIEAAIVTLHSEILNGTNFRSFDARYTADYDLIIVLANTLLEMPKARKDLKRNIRDRAIAAVVYIHCKEARREMVDGNLAFAHFRWDLSSFLDEHIAQPEDAAADDSEDNAMDDSNEEKSSASSRRVHFLFCDEIYVTERPPAFTDDIYEKVLHEQEMAARNKELQKLLDSFQKSRFAVVDPKAENRMLRADVNTTLRNLFDVLQQHASIDEDYDYDTDEDEDDFKFNLKYLPAEVSLNYYLYILTLRSYAKPRAKTRVSILLSIS
jgi:hypothetical protein